MSKLAAAARLPHHHVSRYRTSLATPLAKAVAVATNSDSAYSLGNKTNHNANFVFLIPIHRCVLALYTQYFPESCDAN